MPLCPSALTFAQKVISPFDENEYSNATQKQMKTLNLPFYKLDFKNRGRENITVFLSLVFSSKKLILKDFKLITVPFFRQSKQWSHMQCS